MVNVTDRVIDELHEEVGDALRAVAEYDGKDYDLKFIRDDVNAEYSDEELAAAYQQIEIEGMGYSHFEMLFHIGRMESAIYAFEEALIFHLPEDSFTGIEVSMDRDLTVNLESIIEICKAAIE